MILLLFLLLRIEGENKAVSIEWMWNILFKFQKLNYIIIVSLLSGEPNKEKEQDDSFKKVQFDDVSLFGLILTI